MARRARGQLFERSPGVWRVRLGVTGVDGRRTKISRTVHGRRADAQAALAKLIIEHGEGRVIPNAGSFAEALEDWWETKATARWEENTADRHRTNINAHLTPALGAKQLSALRTEHLDRLYGDLLRRGRSARTVRSVHSTAYGALRHAVRTGRVAINVAEAATLPKRGGAPRAVPDLHVLEAALAWVAANEGRGWGPWLRLAVYTGARPAEVCALRWSDVDLDAGVIKFHAGLSRRTRTRKGTKSDKQRDVAIDAGTVAALREYRRQRLQDALAGGFRLAPSSYLWPADRDPTGRRPVSPAQPSRMWGRVRDRAGLGIPEKLTLYDATRHWHVSWCLTRGFPVQEISARTGHSAETIHRYYAHVLPGRERAIADALGELGSRADDA